MPGKSLLESKEYALFKEGVYSVYNVTSVLVVLFAMDRILHTRSIKNVKPWQVALLIQRVPKMVSSLQQTFTKIKR